MSQSVNLNESKNRLERTIKQFDGVPGKEEWVARMRKELEAVTLPGHARPLFDLFNTLHAKRRWQIVVAGSRAIQVPEAFSSFEFEAHCRQHWLQLTPWEVTTIELMDLTYREESAKLQGK